MKKSGRKCKALNPVDVALAKKKKVSLSDTSVCKYCGKSYCSGKKLTDHINKEHTGEQTIFACPYCSQPFNQYSEYLEHLGEHKDNVQCPFFPVNFTTSQALQDHINEDHGSDPAIVERQCPLCEFTCDNMEELAKHSQSIHCPYNCNIWFLHFSAEYKLTDHRCKEHKIRSMGTSVEGGDQAPELQQPEPVGATKQVEPTPEVCNHGDQVLEPQAQKKPQTKEIEVPPGGIGQQVELDEVKGSEVQTEEHNRECKACHHFFSSNQYRHSHIIRYHKKLLKLCPLCKRRFMFPWDFNGHLDTLHRKCKKFQLYLKDNEQLQEHREIKHPTAMDMQAHSKPQVALDKVTLDTSHQNHQVKYKYCDRHFPNVAKCNIHINRRHKKVACPKCGKHFVKQADCDNHFRDVHKFVCSFKGCSVSKYNELELHEHMRLHHQPEFVFRCNKCIKVFRTRPQLHQHHKVEHGRVKLTDVKGEKYPCLRCKTEFLTESIFVAHSREHKENVPGCNECLWHFNTMVGLIKHCRDTHDMGHFACTLCGEVFGNNADLCRHNKTEHMKLCHVCSRTFVSDELLVDHIREALPGYTVHTQEEMIVDEQAQECTSHQLYKELQRREKKKKKKNIEEDDDDKDDELPVPRFQQ